MATKELVFLGINGSVVSIEKATGRRVWVKKLKGSEYVSVLVDGDRVLAGTHGEISCLDAATGKILWHDPLKGYGWGLMGIATQNGNTDPTAAQVHKAKQEQDSGASAAVIGGTSAG